VLSTATSYIADAYNMLAVHMVLLVVCGVLVATLPLYSKLLKKINTSIQVESNNVEENADAQVAASLDLA
jgi:short subunit fatty acids transporter